MNVSLGELKVAGSVNATPVVLTDSADVPGVFGDPVVHRIKVISGSIKFGVAGIHAGAKVWIPADTDNESLKITCKNGDLYFQANSALDTFVITA